MTDTTDEFGYTPGCRPLAIPDPQCTRVGMKRHLMRFKRREWEREKPRSVEAEARDTILPDYLREHLLDQWRSPARQDARVYMHIFNEATNREYWVTGWDGADTLAAFTRGGLHSVRLNEVYQGGKAAVHVDEKWDPDTRLYQIREMVKQHPDRRMSPPKGVTTLDEMLSSFQRVMDRDRLVEEEYRKNFDPAYGGNPRLVWPVPEGIVLESMGITSFEKISYDKVMNDASAGRTFVKAFKVLTPQARRKPPTATELKVLAKVPRDGWDLGFISKAMVFAKVLQALKRSEHQAVLNLIGKGKLHYYNVRYNEARGRPGFESFAGYIITREPLTPLEDVDTVMERASPFHVQVEHSAAQKFVVAVRQTSGGQEWRAFAESEKMTEDMTPLEVVYALDHFDAVQQAQALVESGTRPVDPRTPRYGAAQRLAEEAWNIAMRGL